MTITLRSIVPTVNMSSPYTFAAPAGTVEGDFMTVNFGLDNEGEVITVPAGFVEYINGDYSGGDTTNVRRFYKIITDSEPADYTFSWVSGAHKVSVATYYDTVGGGSWNLGTPGYAEATSGNPCSPQVLGTSVNSVLLGAWVCDSDPSATTPPPEMTVECANTPGSFIGIDTYYETVTTGGNITRSLTYTGDVSVGSLIELSYIISSGGIRAQNKTSISIGIGL